MGSKGSYVSGKQLTTWTSKRLSRRESRGQTFSESEPTLNNSPDLQGEGMLVKRNLHSHSLGLPH